MFDRPAFKSHLRVEILRPDIVVVREETAHIPLEGRLFPLLVPFLNGEHTVLDMIDRLEGKATALDVRFGLELLEEQGFLAEADETLPDGLRAVRDALGVDPVLFRKRLEETRVSVTSVGAVPAADLAGILERVPLHVEADGDLTLVVTDDYLSSKVELFHRRAREHGRSWMLVKPVGLVVWLGPVFAPPDTPCWACLAARLKENRPPREPSREDGRRRQDGPRAGLSAITRMALSAAATQALAWVARGGHGVLEGRIVTLDATTLRTEEHELVRRYGCPFCGPAPGEPSQDLDLGGHRPVVSRDGGYRTVSPEETLRRFARHVSPITGIVGTLARREVEGARDVHVYVADHIFRSERPGKDTMPGGWRRSSAGKGMSRAQAQASALAEALERYSGIFRGDERRRKGRFRDLGATAVHPSECLSYSDRQYEDRGRWNRTGSMYAWVPQPFDESRVVDWSPVWSVTEERTRYVASAFCYYNYPVETGHDFCRADSNGNAAGNTLEEAIFQGFLELVERDSVALWWYNRVRRPGVDLESFQEPFFETMMSLYGALGREVHVLDLTTDFGIPVVAALSWERGASKEGLVLGFGAHFDPAIGVARALAEMDQFLPGILQGTPRRVVSETLSDESYLEPAAELPRRRSQDFAPFEAQDLRACVDRSVEIASGLGLEILVLDQTRRDVGLPVVKVIVPGLRHFWPRLGPGRLYTVPAKLGWVKAALKEEELNGVHITI